MCSFVKFFYYVVLKRQQYQRPMKYDTPCHFCLLHFIFLSM